MTSETDIHDQADQIDEIVRWHLKHRHDVDSPEGESDGMTLEKAEEFFRVVAAGSINSDTDAAFLVFVTEYDRRAARITELEQLINLPARWIIGAGATTDLT